MQSKWKPTAYTDEFVYAPVTRQHNWAYFIYKISGGSQWKYEAVDYTSQVSFVSKTKFNSWEEAALACESEYKL